MPRKNTYFAWSLFIVLVIVINLMNVNVALADDGTPPPPTDTAVPTEPSVVATEPPVESTPVPVEETPAAETPVEESTPEATPTEETNPTNLLSELPPDTELIILDENQEPLPLASQEATEIVQIADPIWCPESVIATTGPTPGANGCTSSFASIFLLLADMDANPGSYAQNGVIYLERTQAANPATTITSAVIIDNSTYANLFTNLNIFNLTLQGGWNINYPTNPAANPITGQTDIVGAGAYLQIGSSSNPWVGTVTINNIQIGNSSGGVSTHDGLTVYTTDSNISLSNVDVVQQEGNFHTMNLNSNNGDITVGNGSLSDGRNASGLENQGFYAATNSGSISISDTTFQNAHGSGPITQNGATLSAPTVTLTNVIAFDNDGNGIAISNADTVTLNNVTGGQITPAQGNGLSGVYVNGTGSTIVNVFGGTFNNNGYYGVEIYGGVINEQSAPSCTGNTLATVHPCYNLTPNSAPTITVNDVIVEANSASGWTLVFGDIGSASDVEDGTPSVSCTPSIGSILTLGVTNVSCTATDSAGLTASDVGNITVIDSTAPTLLLPADMTEEATSPAGAIVNYTATATDMVDGSVPVVCIPASGSTFALGATTVNCSAADSASNSSSGSFNVHVLDTTAPVISIHPYVSTTTNDPLGMILTYSSPSTYDAVDGFGTASCSPASGSFFPIGDTFVTCNAMDTHGNVAQPVSFIVHVEYQTRSSGNITNGNLSNPDCLASMDVFGIKVTFHNLCNYKAFVNGVQENTLPAQLPNGYSFVRGLHVQVLFDQQIVKTLPIGTGIQLDFPIPANAQDQFAVLLWDDEDGDGNGEWLDVTQLIKDVDLSKTLSTDSNDELYQIAPTKTFEAFYRVLTTEKTGTFVLVK
ncbi:MAG: HYR domain-containing protein [Anaerolineae bacterium]|nr:HYR domain-containing protein [Anaerolineae bacterium]MCI0608772.1 HYR domain-containing protein [Anaerolineae bacterium]